MHTHFEDRQWQAARDRYKANTALPSSLLVPALSAIREKINESGQTPGMRGPSFKEVIRHASVPAHVLSPQQSALLDQITDAVDLVEKVKARTWSVVEVTEAHLRMAAIAQQALGCYSDIFFEKARARARQLDERIKAGEDCGRLCGLPISIKAHIAVEGTGSDRGFIFDVLEPAAAKQLIEEEEQTGAKGVPRSALNLLRKQGDHMQTSDAVHVKALLDEGAVVIAKTVMPQSVMQLDTCSNLHGQTLNPWNLHLSPGGSSGGEAASVAAGGSVLGIGTDIGGSVRQPAAVTGLYGIRCTVGRIGIGGTRSTMLGNEGIIGTAGPLCRSKRDLALVTEILIRRTIESDPFLTPPLPWKDMPAAVSGRRLRVGVLLDDGVVQPITPIRRALETAVDKLSSVESIEIVHCEPGNYYRRGWELARELYFMDEGKLIASFAQLTEEPLLPLTQFIMSPPVKDHTASESWELQYAREAFKREYWRDVWVKHNLDVLLCPAAHLCAPRPGQIRYWGYTSFFNLVDLPGAVFPVKCLFADSKADAKYEEAGQAKRAVPMSIFDEETRQEYEAHRETFDGAPVGLQLIGKRFREEELLSALDVIESAINV